MGRICSGGFMIAELCQAGYPYSPYSAWGIANPFDFSFALTVEFCFLLWTIF